MVPKNEKKKICTGISMIYNFTIILGHENNYKKKLNYFTF